MRNYWCFILLVFFTSSCYEELPDIEQNLLHNEEVPLFEIDSVSILSEIPSLNVRIFYSTKYFELTEEQQEKLPFARILKNGDKVYIELMYLLDEDEDSDFIFYFDDIVEPGSVCYNFFFSGSQAGDFIKVKTRDIELCIDI